MDGDKTRPVKPQAVRGSGDAMSTETIILILFMTVVTILFGIWLVRGSGMATDDGREADGWMYSEVSLVPKACPPLTMEVQQIATGRIMTVRQAKRIAGRLAATAKASKHAIELYEGRKRMGMPTGRPPIRCTTSDPRYRYGEIPMLQDYQFRISDRERG